MVAALRKLGDLFDCPIEGRSHGFSRHSSAGFANGRQLRERPFFRTVLLELGHEQSVRQHDQVHMPGLALAVTQLTVSHAKLLLTVPMKGLRACPATTIDQQNPSNFPTSTVADQDFAGLAIAFSIPNDNDSYFVFYIGDTDGCGEVPLLLTAAFERLATIRINLRGHFLGLQFVALPPNFAVEFQVAHVTAGTAETVFFIVNMVKARRVGEITIESKIAGYLPLARPVDQLAKKLRVVEKLLAGYVALVAFSEAAKFQWVMFPAGTDVVGDQVVVSQLVPSLGMIPKPADVFDEFAVVVDQYVIDGDYATVAVSCAGVLLQPSEPMTIKLAFVPRHFREETVQTGLIRGHGKLAIDATHRFSRGNHQAREVFGKMPTLGFAHEMAPELLDGCRNYAWKRSDPGHASTIPDCQGPPQTAVIYQ